MINTFSAAMEAIAMVLLTWLTVAVAWRGYRLDLFRHKLFGVRHELTLLVADGKLSAEDPAYQIFRFVINSTIYYAENYNFFTLMLWRSVKVPEGNQGTFTQWRAGVQRLSPELQEELDKLFLQFQATVMRHVVTGSVCLATLWAWFFVRGVLRSIFGQQRRSSTLEVGEQIQIEKIEAATYRVAKLNHRCEAQMAAA